ncbi:hypothetical protein [Clostridium sp.]
MQGLGRIVEKLAKKVKEFFVILLELERVNINLIVCNTKIQVVNLKATYL